MRMATGALPYLVPALFLALATGGLASWSQAIARRIEAEFPPVGAFAQVDGVRLHFIDIPAGDRADLPTLVFLHGASGNARDLAGAFAEPLNGRARMIFPDRPGAGYSGRGDGLATPDSQAALIARLLTQIGVEKAVLVGHSLGGAVALALALDHPQLVAGLLLVAPVSHPWPGRGVSWYYDMANLPLLGPLFAYTLAPLAGERRYGAAVGEVFSPDPVAGDYGRRSGTRLVLRPANFLANAADVGALHAAVERLSRRYGEIAAPTVIVSGDADGVVRADIHSAGLKRDIAGARLVWLKDAGHMPTYARTTEIVAEIEALNGRIGNR